jgi:hypothetical protein
MSIVKNYKFQISSNQRVQIRCESNFSVEVLEELVALRPIEVNACMAGEDCILNISLPQGLSAVVLSEDIDGSKPYFADISTTLYNRLSLDLLKEEQTWYIAFSPVYGTSIDMLATKPIVIKCFESGWGRSILFGADEAFRIINARDTRFKKVVSDPSKIPDALLRLVEVIDEPLPENRISLEILEERVRTTKKLLEMYTNKQFSLEVKEEIKLSIAELSDFEMKVQGKIQEIKFGSFGFEAAIFGRVTGRLKQVVGSKKFEQIMASIYKEVIADFSKKQASEKFIKEGNVFERILAGIDDFGVKDDVLRHLNANTHRAFYAFSCSKCSGEPSIDKGLDNKFRVKCKECGNTTSVDFHCKSRAIAIRGWNLDNEGDNCEIESWLAILGLEVDDMNEDVLNQHLTKIRAMNRCLSDMMMFWKQSLGGDVGANVEYSSMNELLEMIKFIGKFVREHKKKITVKHEV